MRLLTLATRDFRNLAELRIEPHPRFNVIVGPNAQGKTNLLEAIYALASLKSFRASRPADMIAFDHDEALIDANLERQGARRHIRVRVANRSRAVWVNDQKQRRLADYLGLCQAVLFAPEDVAMLRASPGERRRFLDRATFNHRAAYLEDLNLFNDVLRQRNALLRDGHPQEAVLSVFTDQLCDLGAKLLSDRLSFLTEYRPFFQEAFAQIFGAELEVELSYIASWSDDPLALDAPPPEESVLRERLGEAFRVRRHAELRRGLTLAGPQRDDLLVSLLGKPAKTHASQGQHRALVLAMKIAEINLLSDRFDREPILLLDDVSSELDRDRSAYLFKFLSQFHGQVFITTTHRDYIPLDEAVRVWGVSEGTITLLEP